MVSAFAKNMADEAGYWVFFTYLTQLIIGDLISDLIGDLYFFIHYKKMDFASHR